jgi:hypothetical protein
MPAPPPTPLPPRRKLPIGIQNLREIRQEGHYYVDKTGMAVTLIDSGKYYFLSRPRRFGKSLLVDTFKELFEGHRELFVGLAAETRWDWSRRSPVIRISFPAAWGREGRSWSSASARTCASTGSRSAWRCRRVCRRRIWPATSPI